MNKEFIEKLHYVYKEDQEAYPLPLVLCDSLQLISDFFSRNLSNKLCLVFPSKEFSAQWLALNLTFDHLSTEYKQNKSDIFAAYKLYKRGQKLLLNNSAVVEWISGDETKISFKTKEKTSKSSPWTDTKGDVITLKTSRIDRLRPAPVSKKVLSPQKTVYENLSIQSVEPIDKLLDISSKGNFIFLKRPVCLVSKIKSVEETLDDIYLNQLPLSSYFRTGKIDDTGSAEVNCPLLVARNLLNLALYAIANEPSKIIIDGFSVIQERGTDFSDIDAKDIPSILITDLSEIESFEDIGNFGFEFFNFTKEKLVRATTPNNSPFYSLNRKLENYISLNLAKEIVKNAQLNTLIRKIHSIENDESNKDLNILKFSLVQLTNSISGVAHALIEDEISNFNSKLDKIEGLYSQTKSWLGDSRVFIEESISLLKSVIKQITLAPSEKCDRLLILLNEKQFDYIICPTDDKAIAMELFTKKLNLSHKPIVISAAKLNDSLLSNSRKTAILTGWSKAANINNLLYSFLFSEITTLFYQFEYDYFRSLIRRNKIQIDKVQSTMDSTASRFGNKTEKTKGFSILYSEDEGTDPSADNFPDILEFELELDNAQYSIYYANGNFAESVRAKRIDFENDCFIYAAESHKFLVINDLIEKSGRKSNLYTRKVEALASDDIIAQINTDRDLLADLVDQTTKPEDLASVKKWTELWKTLLKDYYASVGYDIKALVEGLRRCHCTKHAVTIRTWLQDDSRIGPDDNADLISIALLTGSDLLNDNIAKVREAIKTTTGWRMRASDIISGKIKAKLPKLAEHSIIGTKIQVDGLGNVNILRVSEIQNGWKNIDARFVNRIIQKEIA